MGTAAKAVKKIEGVIPADTFASLYAKHFDAMVNVLISRGERRENAADIVQEAWVKGWEHRAELKEPKYLVSWVMRIAFNVNVTRWRKDRRLDPLNTEWGHSIEDNVIRNLAFKQLLELCPPKYKHLVLGTYVYGMSCKELAKKYNLCEPSVRAWLWKARQEIIRSL